LQTRSLRKKVLINGTLWYLRALKEGEETYRKPFRKNNIPKDLAVMSVRCSTS
jgi:hypothetical protein